MLWEAALCMAFSSILTSTHWMLIAQQVSDTPSVRIRRSPDISKCFLKEAEAKITLGWEPLALRHRWEALRWGDCSHIRGPWNSKRWKHLGKRGMYAQDPDIKLGQGLLTEGKGLNHIGKTFLPLHDKSRQLCPTLRPHGLQPARLLCAWDSPGKNTRVGCHVLLHLPLQQSLKAARRSHGLARIILYLPQRQPSFCKIFVSGTDAAVAEVYRWHISAFLTWCNLFLRFNSLMGCLQ